MQINCPTLHWIGMTFSIFMTFVNVFENDEVHENLMILLHRIDTDSYRFFELLMTKPPLFSSGIFIFIYPEHVLGLLSMTHPGIPAMRRDYGYRLFLRQGPNNINRMQKCLIIIRFVYIYVIIVIFISIFLNITA